jgi:hypothetical protein
MLYLLSIANFQRKFLYKLLLCSELHLPTMLIFNLFKLNQIDRKVSLNINPIVSPLQAKQAKSKLGSKDQLK